VRSSIIIIIIIIIVIIIVIITMIMFMVLSFYVKTGTVRNGLRLGYILGQT